MRVFLFLLVLFCSKNAFTQKISIRVYDSTKKTIDVSFYKIYNNLNKTKLISYGLIREGVIEVNLDSKFVEIYLEVSASSYYTVFKPISITTKQFPIEVILYKKITIEDEVIVKAKSSPISIRNDTTTYRVEKFADGTERKLQDILAKLPGIELNQKSGQIKFKGRPISTILLDGDDLVGDNYTTLSKNLDVDFLIDIQAIENYNDNYVLKDVSSSNDVVLNIRLKKMKYKVSVALDIGLGLIDKKQVANNSTINSLGISNTQKSFGTISYNNIGISNSIIDYSNPQAAAQRNNKNLFVQNYYQTPSFSTPLESKRTNNNNETYINYNNLFKLTTKASLKFNYFGTFDRLRFNQNIDSKFFTTNDSFSQFNNSSNKLDLGNNLASIYFRNNKSKTTLIEATVNGNISNQSNIINGDNNFLGINSIDFIRKNKFIKFNIIYSHRINKNTAVKTEAVLSSNNPDVSVNFSPAFLNRISLSDNMASFLSSKKYLSLANTFFIKYKEFKIEASIAFSNLSLNYRNQLQGKSAIDYITLGKEFGNYTQRQFLQKLSIEKKIKKTTLRFNNNLIVLKQSDSKSIIYNYHHAFYAEPSVNITYKINNKNSFNTSYSRQQKPLYESFLLKNGLLQYNRVFEVNTVNFDFSKVNTLSLNYSLINLYNHFNLSIGGVLENTLGNIVNQVNLNDSIVKFSNEYTILKTNSKIAYFTSKKYLPSIKTTFKFSYNYSSANYYNSISNNNLRENIMYSNQVEFFIKTAFKGFFNFENTTIYNTNTVLPEKSKSNKQYFASFQNTASLLIKPSKYIFATLNNDYFIPNVGKTQKQKAISFIDFSLNFKPKKNKTDYRFIIRNVLNQKQATFIERTDFLFRQQSFSLLPRTIVFNVAFRL